MISKRILLVLMVLIFLIALSGCGGRIILGLPKIQKEAFGNSKRYALLRISSDKVFSTMETLKKNDNGASLGKAGNTQAIIDKLVPKIRAKLAKTGYFHSLPMKTIVNNKTYQSIKETSRIIKISSSRTIERNVAKGYRYFWDEAAMKKLARELNVDGFIFVNLSFAAFPSDQMGTKAVAFSPKDNHSIATALISVVDKDAKQVWLDTASAKDKSIKIYKINKDNLIKLHPTAVNAGEKAVDKIIRNFQKKMARKK